MNDCCEDTNNPLVRDGQSQQGRFPEALAPEYAQVDERQLADLLVFTYRYARQIQYYNINNQKDGHWQAFFEAGAPIQLALIARTDGQKAKHDFETALADLTDLRDTETIQSIFRIYKGLISQINAWHRGLPQDIGLKRQIGHLVTNSLLEALENLIGLVKAFKQNYSNFETNPEDFIPETPVWTIQADTINPTGAFLDNKDIFKTRLETIFQNIYKNYAQIINLAPSYLNKSIDQKQDHDPHLALFFAFLRLFNYTIHDINTITKRHLDFFYSKVLQLNKKPPRPDKAHLLFEPAKHIDEYKLDQGTLFKDGKDVNGVEIQYELEEEFIVNRAVINSLKTIFVDTQKVQQGTKEYEKIYGVHAAPIANSEDGKGGEFQDKSFPAWETMGSRKRDHAEFGFALASDVLFLREGKRSLIFEFSRRQKNDHNFEFPFQPHLLSKAFKVYLSGAKEWLEVPQNNVCLITGSPDTEKLFEEIDIDNFKSSDKDDLTEYILEQDDDFGLRTNIQSFSAFYIVVFLDQAFSSIVPFNSKKLTGNFEESKKPVAKFIINNSEKINLPAGENASQAVNNDLSPYHFFKNFIIQEAKIHTKVQELRNLIVQNDESLLDINKPMRPFGAQPAIGNSFYMGSDELFQKRFDRFTINFAWDEKKPEDFNQHYEGYDNRPSPDFEFKAGVKLLINKQFEDPSGSDTEKEISLFTTGSQSITPKEEQKKHFQEIYIEPGSLQLFNLQTQNGFLKLVLKGRNFLHDQYVQNYSRQVIAQSKFPKEIINDAYYKYEEIIYTGSEVKSGKIDQTNYTVVIPNEPYTPVLTNLYLDYEATEDGSNLTIYNLHPFNGHKKLYFSGSDSEEVKPNYLLPHYIQQGSLLIGLENLDPPQSLSILFQVAESTADTDLDRATVEWYYLSGNNWKKIQEYQILKDETEGLIRSGVIKFDIPADCNNNNTILPGTLHWIKALVKSRSGAICDTLQLHTQAATVVFRDQGNAPSHLERPLPGGSIAKFVQNEPAIKKVNQPYDSFEGKPLETDKAFYTRISEQLRHKGRAISIYDYERLVLEKFSELYKVRCINHTYDKRELKPGHITIAVIPDLRDKKVTNRLKPKVNVNVLKKIKDYLKGVNSPFPELHVLNPFYEEVRVQFKVKINKANFGYYSRQLEDEIIRFLSPWAYEDSAEINFGGKVYKSSILDFVERREYVEYVTDFKMMHGDNNTDVNEITATQARSILVSAEKHTIEDVDEACKTGSPEDSSGIGSTKINQDFKIE